MPESETSQRRVIAAKRQAEALELRRAGATYDAIARQLGYKTSFGAQKAVRKGLERTLQGAPAAEVRDLEGDRLDRLMLGHWQRAIAGDKDAAEIVLKIMSRRAKLYGLDAPRTVEMTGKDGSPLVPEVRSLTLAQFKALPLADKTAFLRGTLPLALASEN